MHSCNSADAYKRKGMYGAAFKKLFADIEPAARLVPASLDSNEFNHENFWKSLETSTNNQFF